MYGVRRKKYDLMSKDPKVPISLHYTNAYPSSREKAILPQMDCKVVYCFEVQQLDGGSWTGNPGVSSSRARRKLS